MKSCLEQLSQQQPPPVQNVVARMAIEMHNLFSNQGASKESQYSMGSLWILLRSRKDCAF